MSIDAYINPDFTLMEKAVFFLAALLGIIISNFFIYSGSVIITTAPSRDEKKERVNSRFNRLVQLFYEMIISATSVMSFACAYIIFNHIYSLVTAQGISGGEFGNFASIWENWKDFILLLLICLSCVFNTILDRLIIPLKGLTKDDKASIRMLAMFYVILILIYLNIIGDENEYSPVMMYYLGLMVGRFVYFDASFMDFIHAVKNAFIKFPLLVLGLTVSGLLSYIGFKLEFLLEKNYYIIGLFYTHLFLLAAVFILHHLSNFLQRKNSRLASDS